MLGQLLVAGIVYLLGMAGLLVWKPSLMFTESGTWKEFGIGRNPATHTWMPIWLFAILWAFASYISVMLVYMSMGLSSSGSVTKGTTSIQIVDTVETVSPEDLLQEAVSKRAKTARSRGKPTELPDGYYVLNVQATEAAGGIPKYVYLGKGLAED
jgi:hypothetical protein